MSRHEKDQSMKPPAARKRCYPRRFWLVVLMASTSLLIACSQTVVAPPMQNAPSVTKAVVAQPNVDKAVRAVVKFRQIVAYRDPAFVQSLSQQTQARISYVSSVSADTHVYLVEPLGMHDAASAVARLGKLPSVLWVELDSKVTPF